MFRYGVFSGPNTGKYGTEKTPYLDTFHAVIFKAICWIPLEPFRFILFAWHYYTLTQMYNFSSDLGFS